MTRKVKATVAGDAATARAIQRDVTDLLEQGFDQAHVVGQKDAPWRDDDSYRLAAEVPVEDPVDPAPIYTGFVSERAAVLREAEELITGDRNETYGHPTENFDNIAALWNVQFGHMLKPGVKFEAAHIAQAHIQTKMARMITQPKRDNYVDVAGYAACGWEAEK